MPLGGWVREVGFVPQGSDRDPDRENGHYENIYIDNQKNGDYGSSHQQFSILLIYQKFIRNLCHILCNRLIKWIF